MKSFFHLLSLLPIVLLAQNDVIHKLDSFDKNNISYETLEVMDSVIVLSESYLKKYFYEYDVNGNRVTQRISNWDGSAWMTYSRNTYTYDENGNRISDVWEGMQLLDSALINLERRKYFYDSNGDTTIALIEKWGNSNWNDNFQYNYIYDSGRRLISKSVKQKNWYGTNWNNIWRKTFAYDNNNLIVKLMESGDGLNWKKNDQYTYSYDINGKVTNEVYDEWSDSIKVNVRSIEYSYDTNMNLISKVNKYQGTNSERKLFTYDLNGYLNSELLQLWRDSNWLDYMKTSYTNNYMGNKINELIEMQYDSTRINAMNISYDYDNNQNIVFKLTERWENNQWKNYLKKTFNYSSNNNLSYWSFEKWYNDNWILDFDFVYMSDVQGNNYEFHGTEGTFYYNEITSITGNNIELNGYHLIQNYPNPFNPSTVIKYQIPANAKSKMPNVKLVVYDILGNEIATLVNEMQAAGNYEVNFDASNLPSGVYIYQLQSGGFSTAKKMMLLK